MKQSFVTLKLFFLATAMVVGMLFYSCNKEEVRPLMGSDTIPVDTIPGTDVDTLPEGDVIAIWDYEQRGKKMMTFYQMQDNVIYCRMFSDNNHVCFFQNGYYHRYRGMTREECGIEEFQPYGDTVIAFTQCWNPGSDTVDIGSDYRFWFYVKHFPKTHQVRLINIDNYCAYLFTQR